MNLYNPTLSLALIAGSLLFLAAAPPPRDSPLRTLRTQRRQVEGRPVRGSMPGSAVQARLAPSSSLSASSAPSAVQSLTRLPLAFEANHGQTDARVRFLSRGPGYTLFLTGTEAVLSVGPAAPRPEGRVCSDGKARKRACTIHRERRRLQAASPMGQTRPSERGASRPGAAAAASGGSTLRLRLLGASRQARITGEEPLPGKSHYFRSSDPAKWRTNVPQYAKVRAEQVYPGIDAVYYGNAEGRLEYDFVVAPGADPNRIRLAFSDAQRVELAPNGDLLLHTAAGTLRQHRPIAYQLLDGRRAPVRAGYALTHASGDQGGKGGNEGVPAKRVAEGWAQGRRGAGGHGRSGSSTRPYVHTPTQITLDLGEYDRTRPLVIDPVLSFSTYLGGSGREFTTQVAVDAAGNVVVAGFTTSTDFPVTPGALDPTPNGSDDAYVAKFDPTGASLLFATYLGGTDEETTRGLALDGAGNLYLCGSTRSANFPVLNAVQTTHAGGAPNDTYLTKLRADGAALVYSTYLGGSDNEEALDVAVDAAGNAYLAGRTSSPNFPTLNALQPALNGPQDAFAVKVNAAGSALVYSTYLGGSTESISNARDTFDAVAVDAAGNAYFKGFTSTADFPTTPGAFDRTANQAIGIDGVVVKINPSGSALVYSTYLGGSNNDLPGSGPEGIAVDAAGRAYVGSFTISPDFPVTPGACDTSFNGGGDGYVSVLDPAGAALVYSTYLGGSDTDVVAALVLDSSGNAHVTGWTGSTDFPAVNPTQPASAGLREGFVATLDPTGATLLFSSYLGGSARDQATDIALDGSGALYVAGGTDSTDFPTLNPYQATHAGGPATNPSDAFLAKIQLAPPPPPPAAPSNLTATAVSQTRIDLAWGDNAGDESGFRVERWNGTNFAPIATLAANTTSYSNTGLTAATTYLYRVLAFNAGGDSPPSNTAEATTLPNPPAAPSNLVATALSQTEIRLTWNENAANEDGLEVGRSTGGPFALHAGLGPNQTSYLDQNLTANTLYVYQVRAVNQGGNSAISNQAGATTLPNPPAAPSGLTATAVSGSQINLAWADNASNETEFVLEVSTDGGSTFAFLTTRGANVTSFSHTGLTPETTRHYRVKARNAGGESAWSNVASATTLQVPPATPTNLTAMALSASEIRLTWNDVNGEQGFRIERRQGNDPFAFVANVGANVTTYTDGGLAANTLYVYRILAFNQAGNSDWSNEASARTLRDRPRPPHSLTAAAISATQVDLAWGDDNEDEQGFLLERSENAGATWSQVASLPANVTRATDTSAQGGRNYQYRLKAWNDVGQSDPSNVASVSTPAAVALAALTVTPAAVRGRRNATGKVTLTGAAPTGGVSVTLSSSNVAASVPSSVTVAAGTTEATFTVTTARVRRNTRVTLTATLAAVQKTATLTVRK